ASDRGDASFDLGLGGGRSGRSASASALHPDAGFLGDDRAAGIVVDPQPAFGITVDLAFGHHAQIHGGCPAAADVVVAVHHVLEFVQLRPALAADMGEACGHLHAGPYAAL